MAFLLSGPAGIIIDTNNFVAKTGMRTFEAAAFLRRYGAEPEEW